MSRRKGNSDEPLLMLDVTHNIRKHKHRHTVKQQPSTSKPISTPPSSSSSPPPSPSAATESPPIMQQPTATSNSESTPPSSSSPAASKQPLQLKSILKKRKRLTRKDLSSITSDLSTFNFDALTLSPTPPSSTSRRQQQPSSPSSSSTQPQQVPSVSFSEPIQDPARSSSSSLTPEPEALVPRVKRTVEFMTPAPISPPEDDTSHHHAPAASLNQSIQQLADRTTQSDLFKGQEVIFDLDFRSELSYDWESEIQCVETVIRNGTSLYAIVRWKDNALAMYPTQLIQRRCHMKVRIWVGENMHKPSDFFFWHLVIFCSAFVADCILWKDTSSLACYTSPFTISNVSFTHAHTTPLPCFYIFSPHTHLYQPAFFAFFPHSRRLIHTDIYHHGH